MAIEYSIDPDQKLIRMSCTGTFTIASLIEHSLNVNEDPLFEPGMNTLADYRKAEWFGVPSDIGVYVEHTEKLAKFRGACKWACLVSTDDDEKVVQTFDLVTQDRGIPIQTRSFYSEEEAMKWLREPPAEASDDRC